MENPITNPETDNIIPLFPEKINRRTYPFSAKYCEVVGCHDPTYYHINMKSGLWVVCRDHFIRIHDGGHIPRFQEFSRGENDNAQLDLR